MIEKLLVASGEDNIAAERRRVQSFLARPPRLPALPNHVEGMTLSDIASIRKEEPPRGADDNDLIALFKSDAPRAWVIFIDRHADTIFSYLHHLGFDYDQAMDRFVYVCEKLCEQDYRRLKSIRYAGQHGELVPWLRQVVKRLCINWAWSEDGRRRLFKSISRLPEREQRVFEMYFWKGLSPSEIFESLCMEHHANIAVADVYDCLERVFSHLSQKKLWRLISNLSRARQTISLDHVNGDTGLSIDPPDTRVGPERELIQREERARLNRALGQLSSRELAVVQLRYEEALAVKEVAEVLDIEENAVKSALKTAFIKLRRSMK